MALSLPFKTAIVTGAGSGINLSFTKLLLEKHCNVLLADLQLRPEAEALVKEYSAKLDRQARAVFLKTDVTDWVQLEEMFRVAVREFGAVHIVCPGAGVYEPPWSNFWHPPGTAMSRDLPSSSRYALLDINLTHPIRTTQLAINYFTRQNTDGCVVHISSIAAQVPFIVAPVYVASKAGISAFVRSLASLEKPPADVAGAVPKIRVVAVAPGVIRTPMWTENPEKFRMLSLEEGGDQWVEPEEVAEAMVAMIEKEEYVGGTILEVGRGRVRIVEKLNDKGPGGSGHTASNSKIATSEVWQGLRDIGPTGKRTET